MKKLGYNVSSFLQDIQECLDLAKLELHNRKNGIQGESSIEQLEDYIMPDLKELQLKINNEIPLPPNNQQERYLMSFGYAFKVWGWDMQNPTELYLKLLYIHEKYREL